MVDNLSLYRFLKSNAVSQYEVNCNEYLVWIEPSSLTKFYELVGDTFFDDGGLDAHLTMSSIVIDVSSLQEYADIDLERVFDSDY